MLDELANICQLEALGVQGRALQALAQTRGASARKVVQCKRAYGAGNIFLRDTAAASAARSGAQDVCTAFTVPRRAPARLPHG